MTTEIPIIYAVLNLASDIRELNNSEAVPAYFKLK